VGEGLLDGLQRRVHLRAHPRHLRGRGVGDVQSQVVAGSPEHGQRLLDERGQLLRRTLRLEVEAEHACLDPPAELADTIPRRRGTLRSGICAPERVVSPACPEQGLAELGLEGEVELGRWHEPGGSLEQADGGAVVLAEGRPVAAGRQAPPRRRGQLVVCG
jgi:hypothetical protein